MTPAEMIATYDICLAVPDGAHLPNEVIHEINAAKPAIMAELLRQAEAAPMEEQLRMEKIRSTYKAVVYKTHAEINESQKNIQWVRTEDLTWDDLQDLLVLVATKERRRARERQQGKQICQRVRGGRRKRATS